MKIDSKGYITLTPRESDEIMECLETLEAMSGAYDEDFTRDCQTAGRYSNKLLNLKISLIDKKNKIGIMKANELRIGNWIKYEDKLVQVVQLSSLMILCQRDENQFLVNCSPKVFKPIELTEEVLLKIGFKKNQHNDWLEYYPSREDEVSILMRDKYTTIEYANLYHCPEDVTEVNYDSQLEFPRRIYIHELQNAYYLLTNKELDVEL